MDTIVVDKKVEHTSGSEAVTTEKDFEEFYQDMKVGVTTGFEAQRRNLALEQVIIS